MVYTHNLGPAQTQAIHDCGFICHTVTDLDYAQLKESDLVWAYMGCLINMSTWVIVTPGFIPSQMSGTITFDAKTQTVINMAIDHGEIRTSIIGIEPGKTYSYQRNECQDTYISWEAFLYQNFLV